MGTNTIQGYEAEAAEVNLLAQQILADITEGLAEVTDPLERYSRLCADQTLHDAVRRAVVAGILRMRGGELRRMADQGATYGQIANATGLGTKGRVNQIIAR